MSEAENAYKAAQREITLALETGRTKLELVGEDFQALNRIPPEISEIENLRHLDLQETQISDLTPLAALRTLEILNLKGTQVADLTPLATLTTLRLLYLSDTQVTDFSAISTLTKLEHLSLDRTKVKNFNPLFSLKKLDGLYLENTLITDTAPLATLTALKTLDLDSTQINDLTFLSDLKYLQTLWVNNTQIEDLTPLAAINGLKSLWLNGTPVSDLTPLAGLTSLQTLWINRTRVSDINPLAALTSLEILNLYSTKIRNLDPLSELINLELLDINSTLVNNLTPLEGLKNLKILDITNTPIRDLSPLANLKELQSLDLRLTRVNDLRPIAVLEKLEGGSRRPGLRYNDIPALKRDARLAELSSINDDQQRTAETLSYLRNLTPWPHPYLPASVPNEVVSEPPEQDPALPLVWEESGFSFLANSIKEDPVTQAALEDLRTLLDDLRRKGNRYDDLYRIAGELQERSTGSIPELNMIKLHLSYQKLRRMYAARATREDSFDYETVTTMEAVFDVLPGVTLADDGVRVLIERQESERVRGLPEEQNAAAEKLLKIIQETEAPFAPEVKNVAAEIIRPQVNDRLTATRGILSRNVVVVAVSFIGIAAVQGAISGPVGNFVYEHGPVLLKYAATMGDDAFLWAQSVLSKFRTEYEIAVGMAREAYSISTIKYDKKGDI